jgi:hypothetical protein
LLTCSFCCSDYFWGYCHYCDYFSGKCTAWDIGIERLCSGPHLLQPVPCKTILLLSPIGPRYDWASSQAPGIENGAFVVTPDLVWYARVLLLFSASAQTDTGSKSFDCALVSTLETYDDPENGNYWYYCHYCHFCMYLSLIKISSLLSLWRLLKLFRLFIFLHLIRMVGINWFASCIRAQPQKSDPVRNTDSEYPGKTASCTSWWHRDHPTPPVPPLSWGAWRPQAGFWWWMPYVVCQFVGIGLVPWYVMKLGGLSVCLWCSTDSTKKGFMWLLLQSTIFWALSPRLWWVKASSSWFFQQCSVLSRCLPSMRVSEWTVVELGWG